VQDSASLLAARRANLATTEKAISILREAADAGAELIAFPESYIPAFPVWAAL
jgi:nitrilase